MNNHEANKNTLLNIKIENMTLIEPTDKILGYFTVNIDNSFVISGFRIIKGGSMGLYYEPPSIPNKDKETKSNDIAKAITSEARRQITEKMIAEYNRLSADRADRVEVSPKTIKSTVDDSASDKWGVYTNKIRLQSKAVAPLMSTDPPLKSTPENDRVESVLLSMNQNSIKVETSNTTQTLCPYGETSSAHCFSCKHARQLIRNDECILLKAPLGQTISNAISEANLHNIRTQTENANSTGDPEAVAYRIQLTEQRHENKK